MALVEIVLTPASPAESVLHLPVAVKPAGPRIDVSPLALAATGLDTQMLTIRNTGNPALAWSIATSGTATFTPLATATTANGQRAGYYVAAGTGDYWAQNVDVAANTRITTLRANGFTLPNTLLNATNTPTIRTAGSPMRKRARSRRSSKARSIARSRRRCTTARQAVRWAMRSRRRA